jgi:hypothetical protein
MCRQEQGEEGGGRREGRGEMGEGKWARFFEETDPVAHIDAVERDD